jgi:hypothetical protein
MFVTEYLIVQFVRNAEIVLKDLISKTTFKKWDFREVIKPKYSN